MAEQDNNMEKIIRRLQSLELRLSRLEEAASINTNTDYYSPEEVPIRGDLLPGSEILNDEEKGLESQIGRFGLAWLGNIVLLFGIAFLTQYLMSLGHRYMSVLLGYVAAGSIFFIAEYLKKNNTHLSFMFKMNAQILLFYITLRLHFFTVAPMLPGKSVSLILLLLIVAFQGFVSVRNKSQSFAVLALIFALSTAMLSDTTHFMLPLVTLTAAASGLYFYRYKWEPLLVLTIFLCYVAIFMWMFGNPFMGHPMQLIAAQHSGILYLFLVGACYSIVLLMRRKDSASDDFLVGMTFVNGILFTLLLLLAVLRFYSNNYVALFAVITVCCLAYSIVLYKVSDWKFASAFYALYGFMAMSIALYGLYGFPKAYLLLSVQSLIVVSMSLWFRNRLIVVMNSLLFFSILLIYLFSSKSISGVNFSFAFVALISARVINWKKSRLQIETDIIRNLYMIEGFFMMLFALYHSVPGQFVTLSWTLAALLYFLLSIILKNVKYRYMALGTMIATALYLFIIDLARIEIVYRVLALLFLAAISIGISIYYTNKIKKSDS